MNEKQRAEDVGHEPAETHDRRFAPVNRGSDARGRTRAGSGETVEPVPRSVDPGGDPFGPPGTRTPAEEGMQRQEDAAGGTGTPGVDVGHPDAIPANEEGVREAERGDASREH
ncbi:hypothetical protein DPM19_29060 [Actinomadura craniellae]|uniref:Uncharacterized protein n=1 Tax=Actinomadura craniellae TaxID=2231787 RepID=A0A365GXV9_9ACTN|nr:hypothetical protein [Actinomadura craniellae]RAY11674.1 hypothetical protein DPM19_29060 [Actinomadura craniellae]